MNSLDRRLLITNLSTTNKIVAERTALREIRVYFNAFEDIDSEEDIEKLKRRLNYLIN